MTSEVSGDAAVGSFGEGHLSHRRRQRYQPEDEERGESLLSPRFRREQGLF